MAEEMTLKEKLRYWREEGGLQIDPRATPTRRNSAAPRRPDPAWERGIVSDPRPDGTSMPLIDQQMNPIRVKAAAERRHEIEAGVKRLKQSPTP